MAIDIRNMEKPKCCQNIWQIQKQFWLTCMSETQNENLKNSFYLDNKPLPALPVEENKLSTKQNIFKQLKTKAKVKFQKLQRLIKKEKFHNQEMIAQVEVKSK
jgi:hypothetical protein